MTTFIWRIFIDFMTSTLLRAQNYDGDFFKFCGLLRKPKLYEGSSTAAKHTKDTPVQAKIDQKRFLLGHLLQQPAKKAKLGRLEHGGKNEINEVALNKSSYF